MNLLWFADAPKGKDYKDKGRKDDKYSQYVLNT